MASIVTRPRGHFWIQLRVDLARRTIRLGKCRRRDAASIRAKIEALSAAYELGLEPDQETAVWLSRLPAKLYGRIAATGLIVDQRPRVDVTLGELVKAFLKDYRAGTAQTKANVRVCMNHLLSYFGSEKPVRSIGERDVARWAVAMEEKYSTATVSTTTKKARQLWRVAINAGIATDNPWLSIAAGDQANASRNAYVPRQTVDKIIAACDPELGLIVALSRYAGLRFCSENYALRRMDVDWQAGRFSVQGKGAGRGKRPRTVPIFAEIRGPLADACERRPIHPETHLVSDARRVDVSVTAVRKELLAVMKQLGIVPWPRLFHNLRASCETDLIRAGYSPHVAAAWLGHSPGVAVKHYLSVPEEDYQRAAGGKLKVIGGA
jgi:integrase